MKVESGSSEVIVITGARGLDPVRVFLNPWLIGGQVVITCWGEAWARGFASTGSKKLVEFLASVDADYLSSAVAHPFPVNARGAAYRRRVCEAVIDGCRLFLKEGAESENGGVNG